MQSLAVDEWTPLVGSSAANRADDHPAPSSMSTMTHPSSAKSRGAVRHLALVKMVLSVCMVMTIVFFALGESNEHVAVLQELDYSPRLWMAQTFGVQDINKQMDFVDTHDEETRNLRQQQQQQDSRILGSSHAHTGKAPEGCEATIMLIRHCEKDRLQSHCNYEGLERSVYLATQFGDDAKWPTPTSIYALAPGHRNRPHKQNFRELETVYALATQSNLDVNEDYSVSNSGKLAKHLLQQLQNGELCGKLVLISWKHSDMGRLARKLGCGPLEGCPVDYRGSDFDSVWQIKLALRRFPTHGHNHHHEFDPVAHHAFWKVFGSVQREAFDPLAYSKLVGDYPTAAAASHHHRHQVAAAQWAQQLSLAYPKQYLS